MDYIKQNLAIILVGTVVFAGSGVGAYALLDRNDADKPAVTAPIVIENSTSPKSDDSNEACDLFSTSQIASAFGGGYSEGKPGYASDIPQSIANPGKKNEDLKNYSCSFEQENDGTPAGKAAAFNLNITVNNFSEVSDAQKYLDTFIEMLEKGEGVTKVDNVADQAFFASSATGEEALPGIEMLYVRADKKVYVFAAGSDNPIDRPDARGKMIKLASTI